MKLKVLDICGNDLECTLIKFNPECEEDLLTSKSFEDNLIRKRRFNHGPIIISKNNKILERLKRVARLNSNTNKNKTRPRQKKERIEIKFKFIGKNHILIELYPHYNNG